MKVVVWKAELSNGEVVCEDPKEPASWRRLMEKCRREDLQVTRLFYNNVAAHENAEAYFVFFEQISFLKGGFSRTKKGIGCIYTSGDKKKVRINWYLNGTDNFINTEVRPITNYPIAQEVMIPRCKGISVTG